MQSDDPIFFPVGTEVSAKFRGAFCIAKVKRVDISIRCKVLRKTPPYGVIHVSHIDIEGELEVNAEVSGKSGGEVFSGFIQQIKDNSTYHVVFDDGDEGHLKRNQVRMKGPKFFDDDNQHCPVTISKDSIKDELRNFENDRTSSSVAAMPIASTSQKKRRIARNKRKRSSQRMTNAESKAVGKKRKINERSKVDLEVGQVVAAYSDASRKSKWTPAVVVSPNALKSSLRDALDADPEDVILRSFKDNKYFTSVSSALSLLTSNSVKMPNVLSKAALDRAQVFLDKGLLPAGWDHYQIYGALGKSSSKSKIALPVQPKKTVVLDEKKDTNQTQKPKDGRRRAASSDISSKGESSSEDSEYGAERDQFTAQLYKFHEERGTPINKAPILGGQDIDMFRLHNVVQMYGGKKKVTEKNRWKKVLNRLRLEVRPGATPLNVKKAYSRYLDHFVSFYRSLGLSNWPTPSTSSRSARVLRRAERDIDQPARKKEVKKRLVKKQIVESSSTEKEKLKESSKKKADSATDSKSSEDKESNSVDVGSSDERVKETGIKSEKASVNVGDEAANRKRKIRRRLEETTSRQRNASVESIEKPLGKLHLRRRKKVPRNASVKQEKIPSDKSDRVTRSRTRTPVNISDPVKSTEDSKVDEGGKNQDTVTQCISCSAVGILQMKSSDSSKEGNDVCMVGVKDMIIAEAKKSRYFNASPFVELVAGQDVIAYHNGNWYVAKISKSESEASMDEIVQLLKQLEKTFEGSGSSRAKDAAKTWFMKEIESIRRRMKCFVHYVGWNIRYDEYVEYSRICVAEKDWEVSVDALKQFIPSEFPSNILETVLKWLSIDFSSDICTTNAFKFGRFRVSVATDYEFTAGKAARIITRARSQSNNSMTMKKRRGSAFSSRSTPSPKVFESNVVLAEKGIKFMKSASSSNIPELPPRPFSCELHRISSDAEWSESADILEMSQLKLPVPTPATSPLTADDPISLLHSDSAHDRETCEELLDHLETKIPSPVVENICNFVSCIASFHHSVVLPANDSVNDRDTHAEKIFQVSNQLAVSSFFNVFPDGREEEEKEITCLEQIGESDSQKLDDSEATSSDSIQGDAEELVYGETEFRELDDPDHASSLSECKLQRKLNRCGLKRKRIVLSGKLSVSDRKCVRSTKNEEEKESEEDSETEVEDHIATKDSLHALKTRLQHQMDDEMVKKMAKEMGIREIDETAPCDERISFYSEEIQKVRELYHEFKSEQARLDRKYRMSVELRKQRDRERKKEENDSQLPSSQDRDE